MSPQHPKFLNIFRPIDRKPHSPPQKDPAPSTTPDQPPEGDKPSDVLVLSKVDFQFDVNGQSHHTNRFELMTRENNKHLVIRRGQTFTIALDLNRPYNKATDKIAFVFRLDAAKKINMCNDTFVLVPMEKEIKCPKSWNAVGESEGNSLTVEIITPHDCIVGIWSFGIRTGVSTSTGVPYTFESSTKIYILFNAWCQDDQVYLQNKREREEYVENDSGVVWKENTRMGIPWDYNQYDNDVLDCVMYLITEVANIPLISCYDPVKVCRGLSSAVNSNDNGGVLKGLWAEKYPNGKEPWYWGNSIEIIQQYYKSCKGGQRYPVSYGQCWVFASVLTTVCRAIGLPTRSVTCYGSAHDAEGNLTIDFVVDSSLRKMDNLCRDSDWNFHVWNEVWMKRPDLGEGDYDGWNAVDATPQEVSEGEWRCGPASVKAIQKGEALLPHDTHFVFAEMNAVENYWKYNGPTQPLKLLFSLESKIGWEIITKEVGSLQPDSVLDNYRYTKEKHLQFYPGMIPKFHDTIVDSSEKKEEFKNITITVDFHEANIYIGKRVRFNVLIDNKSTEHDYTVQLTTRVDSVTYRGIRDAEVKLTQENFVVAHGSEHKSTIEISYEEYFSKLVDQNHLEILSVADVKETGFEYVASKTVSVRVPEVKIQIQNWITDGRQFWAQAFFTNPLTIPLTNCKFTFEGVGMSTPVVFDVNGEIHPGDDARADVTLVPFLRHTSTAENIGNKSVLSTSFTCDQLKKALGFLECWIDKAKN